ncbi:rhodanese-like domain-containing protein [Glutamicibacter sp. X7]
MQTQQQAIAHFSAKLAYETDVADVHAALEANEDFVLVDTRSDAAWEQGHIPGAVHLPTAQIPRRAHELIPAGTAVVTYCWSPGCNGATRAALAFAQAGYRVKEMLGGIEYWIREGFDVATEQGLRSEAVDARVAPRGAACGC